MNENYLWDKTENDSEIEKLENVLKAFRYQENAAPELPAKILQLEPRRSRRFLSFAFAFAASVAFIAISLGIWLGISKKYLKGEIETANISLPQISTVKISPKVEKEEVSVPFKTKFSPTGKYGTTPHFIKTKFVKPKNFVSARNSLVENVAENDKPKTGEVKLTREEKYAYSQLMLALSITSSKLKFVKDKVDGLEKSDSVYSDGKYK